MPIFAWAGGIVAGWFFAAGTAAFIATSWLVATAAAFVTSRIINGNANKGNNSAGNQGGRIQVPPASNNKIPVVYGSAYVNGIITDARLITTDNKINDTMFYCIVLSETSNNIPVGSPVYGLEGVYWNDLRLTPDATDLYKVKDGRKVVDGAIITAGSFVVGKTYIIRSLGTTTQINWNTIAGTSATPRVYELGSIFTCANAGTGTGTAQEEDWIDTNFVTDNKNLVQLRVYAGSTAAADQIYPPQSSGQTQAAYDFWGDNDNSWTTDYAMEGLVFAIVRLTYNGEKGFTSLPNVTFQLANNVANPADVWYDYMTSERYGANIDPAYIDETARLAWYNYCEEDISYTNAAGNTNQSTLRYNINGVIDTSNQVKTNIDTILQNGGAWMSYDVSTGLWRPVIKKAITAGDPTETTTHFTASRNAGNELTVTVFPEGRIETGQLLYNSAGTLIGTITGQVAPTAGQTAGQIGKYTTSTSGAIASTTFYTTAPNLLEFSDDNIISGINISSTRLDDLYNKLEVEFFDRYNKDQKAYYRVDLPQLQRNPNEPDNQLRMSLDLVNNSMQSDILGQVELRQSRDDLVIEFTANHYGIQAQAGDIVAVTSDLYGWYPKLFRVMRVKEQETEDGGLVAQIQGLEYNGDAYTIEPITEFTTEANVKIGIGVYGTSPNMPLPPRLAIVKVNDTDPIPNFQLQVQIPATGGPYDEIEFYVTEGWDEMNITGNIVAGQIPVTGASGTGSVATLTFTPASPAFVFYEIGQVVTIAGMTPSGYNGVKTITGVTTNSISYASTATGFTTGGTITSEVGASQSIMTVTSAPFGTINVGDYFDLGGVTVVNQLTNNPVSKTFFSGGTFSPPVNTVTLNNTTGLLIGNNLVGTGLPTGGAHITAISGSQVTLDTFFTAQAAGTYTVFGGLGTYTVSQSVTTSGTDTIFDLPIPSDYNFFKKVTPNGNTATFTNGETINVTITELPANTQTYRRWFIISRMGIKKRFGAFSVPTTVDKDGNFHYEPDAGAGSVTVLNITKALVKLDFGSLVIPNNGFLLFRTMNPVDFGNDNNIGSSAQLDLGLVSVVENTVTSATTDVETFVWQIDPT
jgi:hypothetical protein